MLLIQKEEAQGKMHLKHQELMQSYESRSKFFSLIAHDLRSPLSSLVQGMQVLKFISADGDINKRNEMTGIIADRLSQTYQLTDNLLRWSLSEKGIIKPNFEAMSIYDAVKATVELVQADADSKNIILKLAVNKEKLLLLDKNMFSTVIRNLLSNAIKFTPKGGTISIISEKNIKERSVKIHVKDTGVGIPEDKLSKLFTIDSEFHTDGTNKEKGTGFGLKLSAELIHKLNGKIYATRNEDVGTTITLEFPIETIAPQP
ncbi:MAG: sensor histidine kinase [Bacteroidota bacterium]